MGNCSPGSEVSEGKMTGGRARPGVLSRHAHSWCPVSVAVKYCRWPHQQGAQWEVDQSRGRARRAALTGQLCATRCPVSSSRQGGRDICPLPARFQGEFCLLSWGTDVGEWWQSDHSPRRAEGRSRSNRPSC